MSIRNNPHRIQRRSHPRPSPQQTQQPPADTGNGFTQLFQGAAFDPEIGMYDFASRAFDPAMKRWVQDEPLAYVDGRNAYVVCADNPIVRVEPAGGAVGDAGGC